MLRFQLQLLAIGFFAVLLLSAVFAISGNGRRGRGWGWPALFLATAISLLIIATFGVPE
jgi:hypothetical protein